MNRYSFGAALRRGGVQIFVVVLLLLAGTQSFADDERYIKINRSIELFGRVYQEIINNYVDEIDPEQFMRAGIEGMLGTLDPYTTYIDESGRDEVDLLTTGRYGGVGVTIGVRDDQVTITSVTEGYSAAKQGIMIGDRIITVSGVDVKGKRLDEIRSQVRGEPGSTVEFVIERDMQENPLTFILVRESIRVRNLTFADFIDDGIVYLKLERFSRGAGGETRNALRELKKQRDIHGIILDLRNNSGGLLDAAVEITDLFVQRGTLIVSTRGRTSDSVRRYVASQDPLFPETPLVVLINGNSASASEIVAGAIQDLDRGVLVGTRSFGKGLVQTVSQLTPYAQLKMTTSRYYTPSGRSIQTSDYFIHAPLGLFSFDPDSVKQEYRSSAGRPVIEGDGIAPDSTVDVRELSAYAQELIRRSMFFLFATDYVHSHPGQNSRVEIDDAVVDAFKEFLNRKQFKYQETGEVKLKELRTIGENEKYNSRFMENIDELETYIAAEKTRAFDRHRDEIVHELEIELAARYSGERGRIEAEFSYDTQLNAALDFLKNKTLYDLQLTVAH
jgi:carboxyl-terminal processing protease